MLLVRHQPARARLRVPIIVAYVAVVAAADNVGAAADAGELPYRGTLAARRRRVLLTHELQKSAQCLTVSDLTRPS